MAVRHLLLLLATVGLLTGAVVDTGAFSSASLDRGVTVSVAPPESAYLGIAAGDLSTVPNGGVEDVVLVTLTNNLGTSLSLTVEVTESAPDSGPNVTNVTAPTTLQPGDSAPVLVDATCDSAGTEDVEVAVDAVGDGVRIEGAARNVTLTCA